MGKGRSVCSPAVVLGKPPCHRVCIFPVNAGKRPSPDIPATGVVAQLDAGEGGAAVHDIRLAVDNGALEESVGQQVADPEVGVGRGSGDGLGTVIGKGFQSSRRRQGPGYRVGGTQFLRMRPAEQFHQQGEAFVLMGEFFPRHGAAEQEVEVVLVGEGRARRVAPLLGVEVEANDKIGTESLVDEPGAVADLGDAIEKPLRFLLKTLARRGDSLLREGSDGCLAEVAGAYPGGRAVRAPGQPDLRSELFEPLLQEPGDDQRHLPFLDGAAPADPEPAGFHAGVASAEVAGIEGDAEAGQRFSRSRNALGATFPEAWSPSR